MIFDSLFKIADVRIFKDDSNKSLYAFLEFNTVEDAYKAL